MEPESKCDEVYVVTRGAEEGRVFAEDSSIPHPVSRLVMRKEGGHGDGGAAQLKKQKKTAKRRTGER